MKKLKIYLAIIFCHTAFFLQSTLAGNIGFSANDVYGNANTDIFSYTTSFAKNVAMTLMGVGVAGGSFLLVTGIWKLSKQGKHGGQDDSNFMHKIVAGAMLVGISIIIAIVSHTMSNPDPNGGSVVTQTTGTGQ